MSIKDFKSKVNSIMDVIWAGGLTNHTAVIELMIYIIFLRELHKHDQEQMMLDDKYKPIFTGDLAMYSWDNLLSLNADTLFVVLGDAFEKLSEKSNNQTVKMLYNKAHLKLFAKPALRTVVHKIEELMKEVELEEKTDRTDLFGDLYEYLLDSIASAGTGGQFRTPRHIIRFMVDVLDPGAEESICDPACGTGGFLVAVLEHLKRKYTSEDYKKEGRFTMDLLDEKQQQFLYNQTFTGFDSDPDMIKFGLMNLYFHKLENATIKRRNTLTETQGDLTKWDIILANPPFAGKIDRDGVAEELQMNTGATEVLFLNFMIRHLTDRGRCAVIVPEGVIFQSARAHKEIRRKLVEDAGLWAVASLPSGVFNPYAGVKTSILFFDKTKKETNNEIAFVKINNDGFDLGAQRRPIDKNDLPQVQSILNKWEKGEKTESELVIYVEKEKITEDGEYSLSGDRYHVDTDYSNTKWKMVELGEVLNYEQPTKYIVKSVDYDDSFSVPVLTAGKSFILGYTNEKEGVFNKNLPVIIFDDFTTATKFVDFPFKVKSSAMKILHGKKDIANIHYLFYIIQKINFNSSDHKRYWISEYSKIKIPLPPLEVQEKIVSELEGYQKIIDGAKQIIENWKPKIDINSEWEGKFVEELVNTLTPPEKIQKSAYKENGKYQIIDQSQNQVAGFTDDEKKIVKIEKPVVVFGDHTCSVKYVDNDFAQGADGIKILDCLEGVMPKYLYYYLISHPVQSDGYKRHYGKLKKNKIKIPKPETQKKIIENIDLENELVESSRKLVEIYERRVKDEIAKLWSK